MTSIIVIILFGGTIFLDMKAMSNMSSDSQKRNHPTVQGGNFLLDKGYNVNTKIVADNYSYIPERFTNATMVGGIDENVLGKYSPEILIINKNNTLRWSWKQEGTSFKDNKFIQGTAPGAVTYFGFHQKLFSNPDWNIVYENEDVVILELVKSPVIFE